MGNLKQNHLLSHLTKMAYRLPPCGRRDLTHPAIIRWSPQVILFLFYPFTLSQRKKTRLFLVRLIKEINKIILLIKR